MSMTSSRGRSAEHAITMDRVYRYQRHIYDITRKYYLFGRDTMLKGLDVPEAGRVLEAGCGTGRNLLRAARSNPQGLFYGFDISSQMLASASSTARRSRQGDRIFITRGDAQSFAARHHFGLSRGFDRAYFSYTLSMVPDWQAAVRNTLAQLNDEGSLHIVDFGTMRPWPAFARTAMSAWLAKFHVAACDNLFEGLSAIAGDTGYELDWRELGGGYASIAVLRPRHGSSSASGQVPDRANRHIPSTARQS